MLIRKQIFATDGTDFAFYYGVFLFLYMLRLTHCLFSDIVIIYNLIRKKYMKAIFITENRYHYETVYTKETREKLEKTLDFVEPLFDTADLDRRKAELNEVDVIFSTWGMPALSREQISTYFSKVKALFYGAGSVQYFARPVLESGICLFSAWAANAVPVAEYTVAQIILANKGFFRTFHRYTDDTWDRTKSDVTGNYGNPVGLIGIGMIGSLVAKMLKAYDIPVLAYDPFLSKEKAAELGIELCSIEKIFSECTVISNHLANNPQTVGMLNGKLFDLMRPDAAFINTGRGAQVVESDLIKALKDEPSRIALLDVTMPEPPEKDSKLYKLRNVFLSPHIAGSIGNEVARMGEYMAKEFERWSKNEKCMWQVTEKMLETMA